MNSIPSIVSYMTECSEMINYLSGLIEFTSKEMQTAIMETAL